jgi:hypothetical protein
MHSVCLVQEDCAHLGDFGVDQSGLDGRIAGGEGAGFVFRGSLDGQNAVDAARVENRASEDADALGACSGAVASLSKVGRGGMMRMNQVFIEAVSFTGLRFGAGVCAESAKPANASIAGNNHAGFFMPGW